MYDVILSDKDIQKCSLKDKFMIYGYITKLLLKSKKRTYDVINNEYDLGVWNRDIEKIDFETRSGNYNRSDLNDIIIFTHNDKLFKCIRSTIEKKFDSILLSVLADYKEDSVVELGCGLGVNLFLLYKAGFRKLEGYDLSENAISRVKQYSEKKEMHIHFGVHDLNQPFTENMIKDKVVFTSACLEQCKLIMPNILKNIIKGRPKVVLNFEVDYDSSPLMVKKYFDACGYQNNLVTELKKLEKQKKIEITSIEKLPLSLSPVNRLSAITWKVS